MSLFRRSNEPIKFILLSVDEEELEELKIIIVENGGTVSCDDPYMRIKFSQNHNYSNDMWPGTIIYDVKFIRQCAQQSKIIDPEPYRMSPKFISDECLMSHFLFGYCECRRFPNAPVSAMQPITSGSLNEYFTPPTRSPDLIIPNRSGNPETLRCQLKSSIDLVPSIKSSDTSPSTLSPSDKNQLSSLASTVSSNNRQHNSSNSSIKTDGMVTTVAASIDNVDSLNTSSSLDESLPVVKFPHVVNRVLPSGDSDSAPTIDDHEKRPCSVEYQREVEPKLRLLDRLRKKQQRTPTTLSNGSNAPAIAVSEISSGNLDGVAKLFESCERAKAASGNDPNNLDVGKETVSPPTSEASTILANYSPQRMANVRKRLNSDAKRTLLESTRDTAKNISEDDTPINKDNKCKNRKRQLPKESLESNLSPTKHSKSSVKDSQDNSTSKTSPGEVNLSCRKVRNPFFKNDVQVLENPSTTKSKPKEPIEDEESDDAILISRVPCQLEEQSSSNSAQNNDNVENSTTHCDDEDWNKPGPSRISKARRTLTQADILSGISSSDEVLASRIANTNGRASSKQRNRICTSDERETSADSDETNLRKTFVRSKRKRRARRLSELEPLVKKNKSSKTMEDKHQNGSVKIIVHEENRAAVDPKDVIIVSSADDDDETRTLGRRTLKTTNNCVDRSTHSKKNKKHALNVDRSDNKSSRNTETRAATTSHKSPTGKKSTKNTSSKSRHNGNNEINYKQSPTKGNTKRRAIAYSVSTDSDFSDSCDSERIDARVESRSKKTSSSQVRSETNRENVKHRRMLNQATKSNFLGSKSKSLSVKLKEQVPKRLKTRVICRTIDDLTRQSKLGVILVKLANKDPILLKKAHELNLLVQDSETEDDNDDDDDDDDDTHTSSDQNHNRDKTSKNSSNGKDRDKRKPTIIRSEIVTLTDSKKSKSFRAVGTKKSIESSSEQIKNSSSNGNRNAIEDTDQIVNLTSEDSDSSVSFSEVVAHSTMRATQISKSTPKKSENNRSSDQQRDKAKLNSSTDGQRPINRDTILDNRAPYTTSETNEIIKYLVRTNSIQLARGRKIFEEMSTYKKLEHRSPSSLYNRFQKILPYINRLAASLKLRPAILKEFTKLKQRERSARTIY